MSKLFFVFDVESIGLHGEGFAVGWTVVDQTGKELDHGISACPRDRADGNGDDRTWVANNIPIVMADHEWPYGVRSAFWLRWLEWKEKGAVMAADCLWPVEAKFLCRCISEGGLNRKDQGPYPFIDIGSVLFAKGIDPLSEFPRLKDEVPKHNPLADARQSARILIETLYLNRP